MPFVLDCSVALAWVLPDEHDDRADELLNSLTKDVAVVPQLWPLEVGNVLLMAERRKRIDQKEIDKAFSGLGQLPIEVDLETHERAFPTITRIAARYRLTVYDAAYLELASRRNLPLASLDKQLMEAAKKAGIGVA